MKSGEGVPAHLWLCETFLAPCSGTTDVLFAALRARGLSHLPFGVARSYGQESGERAMHGERELDCRSTYLRVDKAKLSVQRVSNMRQRRRRSSSFTREG